MDEKNRIVWVNFFPLCENVHLTKDTGIIPYILHKDFGYDSCIICYKNGEYPNLEKELHGLKMVFMNKGRYHILKKIFRRGIVARGLESLCLVLDALTVIIKYGRRIDVLELNHIDDQTIAMAWLYRIVNGSGIIYIKLDLDPMLMELFEKEPEKYNKQSHFLYRTVPVDIMSIETKELLEFARTKHPYFKLFKNILYYIPTGIDVNRLLPKVGNFSQKENIILHVSRMGTYQKATEILLEAFAKVANESPDWKLVLIGTMENDFTNYFKKFLEKNSHIKNRISYLGFVSSREKIYEYYNISKIFIFPSRFESFGCVVVEAEFFGDVFLGTNIPSNRELTNNGEFGYLCPVDDVDCFSKHLRFLMSHEGELYSKSVNSSRFVQQNYDWYKICSNLNDIVLEKLKNKNYFGGSTNE